jgi:hypothetical protein
MGMTQPSPDAQLPEPFVPAHVDLRDFTWMPLEIARLDKSRSWRAARRHPALAFYMLNLWKTAWHNLPAGSLENDDDDLMDHAGCATVREWEKARAQALRNWVLCSDGRLYHKVVAEKVLAAWEGKMLQRWKSECGRIKKHNQRHKTNIPFPTIEEWTAAGRVKGGPLPVPRDNGSKGEGEGEGELRDRDRHHSPTTSSPDGDHEAEGEGFKLDGKPYEPPNCPHFKVLELWSQVLPELPQHDPAMWKNARRDNLARRWRETAVAKQWLTEADGLRYFQKFFKYIGTSKFLTGRAQTVPGKRPFVAELEWIVNPTNWAKVHEGKYHHED